jgi:hypothetical protein
MRPSVPTDADGLDAEPLGDLEIRRARREQRVDELVLGMRTDAAALSHRRSIFYGYDAWLAANVMAVNDWRKRDDICPGESLAGNINIVGILYAVDQPRQATPGRPSRSHIARQCRVSSLTELSRTTASTYWAWSGIVIGLSG